MSCGYFAYLILFIILQWSHCSLLSRFRYPNEYTAPPESIWLPEDLPDDMYEGLIDERPDLEPILSPLRNTKLRRPKTSYTRKTTVVPFNGPSVYHEFEFPRVNRRTELDDEDEEEYTMSGIVQYTNRPERLGNNTTESSAALSTARSSRMLPFILRNNGTYNDTRKWFVDPKEWLLGKTKWFVDNTKFIFDVLGIPPWDRAPVVATCYTCGHTSGIPISPICHDLFDSQDWRARTLKRFFRSSCYFDSAWSYLPNLVSRKKPLKRYRDMYENDPGRITEIIGPYMKGCYKRFLDIGTVYTARGCRGWYPSHSGGLAGSRFGRLEYLLRHHRDRCITSPHASLTPFSRGISLFARYHVCVCPGRYCNRATVSQVYNVYLLFLSLIFIALLI